MILIGIVIFLVISTLFGSSGVIGIIMVYKKEKERREMLARELKRDEELKMDRIIRRKQLDNDKINK